VSVTALPRPAGRERDAAGRGSFRMSRRKAAAPQIPPDPALSAEIARLDRLADLLDSRFRIPGTRIRFGLDGLIGLVPGIGDTLVLAPAVWLVWRASQLGVPRRDIARMAANTGADYAIGLVPILGDLFDVAFKGNRRNIAILRAALERAPQD
jgi:hypothetical protein